MQALGRGNSDVGQKRSQNEDRYVIDDELGLYVVSDGMGGHAAGEVAAETAINAVVEHVKGAREELAGQNGGVVEAARLVDIGRTAVEHACAEVYRLATSSSEYSGMGCTLTLLLVTGNRATLAHVGDTRLYLHRGGQTYQMTTDHTFSAELVRSGYLKHEDAKKHMYSNVLTRCIGSQPAVQIDTLGFEVFSGDRFLLCSDGLSEYVPNLDWLSASLGANDPGKIPDHLIAFANEAGGHDNITAVVVEVDDPTPELPEPRRDSLYDNDALAGIFLFHSLPLVQLEQVRSAFEVRLCGTGETLVSQGEPNATLWIVADGAVEVSKDDQVITVLGPGGHVGTGTLLCRRAAGATLRARTPSRVLALEGQALLQLAHSHPWLGLALLEKLATWLSGNLAPGDAPAHTLQSAAP
ncbi:MAG TPA: protein phosphatase 2C domain-containing protein, partial [Polyangiaceae bacterium]